MTVFYWKAGWKGRFFNTELKTRPQRTQSLARRARRPDPGHLPASRTRGTDGAATLCVLCGLVFNSVLKKQPLIPRGMKNQVKQALSVTVGGRSIEEDRRPESAPALTARTAIRALSVFICVHLC